MNKLLIIGVNTRAMVNSAVKLNYEVYSSSYYKSYDFKNIKETHILKQKENISCGFFEEKFNPQSLLENCESFLELCDYIILASGISPSNFKGKYKKYLKKVLGNTNIKDIEDKYLFYKKNYKDFLIPETFNNINIHEVEEIIKNTPESSYILKPVNGSGGYGVYFLNTDTLNQYKDYDNFFENSEFIMQKHITGINISSSLLSTRKTAKNIINSRLLNQNDYNKESYKYSGNILPLDENTIKYNTKINYKLNIKEINKEIKEITEKLIKKLKLIGNNGVDMILTPNNEIYLIEVNPRIQGTYECIEKLLNINLLNAHIKACQGELIEIPKYNGYSIKKLLYTENKIKIAKLNYENIYDIPYPNTIFEKEQPLVTLINKDNSLEKVENNIKISEKQVNYNISIIN